MAKVKKSGSKSKKSKSVYADYGAGTVAADDADASPDKITYMAGSSCPKCPGKLIDIGSSLRCPICDYEPNAEPKPPTPVSPELLVPQPAVTRRRSFRP